MYIHIYNRRLDARGNDGQAGGVAREAVRDRGVVAQPKDGDHQVRDEADADQHGDDGERYDHQPSQRAHGRSEQHQGLTSKRVGHLRP